MSGIWIRDKDLDKTVISWEGGIKDITSAKIRFKVWQFQDWWLDKYDGFNLGEEFYLWLENLADNTTISRYPFTYHVGIYENEQFKVRIEVEKNIERHSDSHWLKKWGGKLQKPLGTPTVSTLAKQNGKA
mgnify:CR=1 FL=1|jgi:hypothetical protein|tara:strand:+ start:48 stop:437 length:390 start_codon:yes stop_codon:yes gene_type:complete